MSENKQPILVLLLILSLLNGYLYIGNQKLVPNQTELNTDFVSGIVIYRSEYRIWLRLSSPDENGEVGSIVEYNIEHNSDIDRGNFIQGKISTNNTLTQVSVTPFLEYDYNDGLMVEGDLVLFRGGKIQYDLSDPFPTIRFRITNLGSQDIIGVRVWIDENEMPFTLGISSESPIKPSREATFDHYTAWYTSSGDAGGYLPVDGEEYNVKVSVKLSDLSTQSFTSSGTYYKGNKGSISSMFGRDYLFFHEPDLVWLGRGEGGSLTLSFRNTWYQDGQQIVTGFKIYLNDELLTEASVNIRSGQYYAINVPIPYDITPLVSYDVKLVAYSETGLNSTYSEKVICQYIRIN